MKTIGLPSPRLLAAPPGAGPRLRGIGACQPERVLTGDELGERVGRTGQWIEARTGIREIRMLAAGESLLGLALTAAEESLRNAAATGAPSVPVDLVIGASCSLTVGAPPLGAQIAQALAPTARSMDLNAACAGFCYSLATADALIRSGAARRILLVAAEQMTALVDPGDLGTSILFGDGAGALVVDALDVLDVRDADGAIAAGESGAADELHLGPVVWGSDGANADLIEVGAESGYMTMAGQAVFRWATSQMQLVGAEALRRAGVSAADVQVFVPHQANARIVDALTEQLGLQHAVVSRDVTTSGNTSAASIPIALSKLRTDGATRTGDLALLVGFGAGLSYAAQVVRLP